MATSNRRFYALYVNSADVTAWAMCLLEEEPRELYVEIRLEELVMHAADATRGCEPWNEEFLIKGNSSSTISLSLVPSSSGPTPKVSCVGCVDVVLGTLLERCADFGSSALEVTSVSVDGEQPVLGIIRVQLSEEDNLDEVATKMDALAESQLHRFERLGNLFHLESAISYMRMAVGITDDEHPDKPMYLSNLGIIQQTRFERLGDISDLEYAISNNEKSAKLTDEEHSSKPGRLSSLGITQRNRFERLGDLSDLDNAISNIEKAFRLTDDRHPDKPMYLSKLGMTQRTRFEIRSDICDLENAISNNEMAVKLTDDTHQSKPGYLMNLGIVQQTRFECLGDLSDLENAISNIVESVVLVDDGHPDKPTHLSNLCMAQQTRFMCLGNLSDLENAISNVENAVKSTDDRHPSKPGFLSNLGVTQQARFQHIGDISDLENAIFNKEKAVQLTDDEHPDKPMYLSNLGNSQDVRFERLGDLSDVDNAILNIRKAVDLTDDGHARKAGCLANLGNCQDARFRRLGDLSDLDNAISNIEKAVQLTYDGHPDKPMYLSNLGNSQDSRFRRLGDLSDIEKAISNIEQAVILTDDGHPDMPGYLSNLSTSQDSRFQLLGGLSDLEKAILNAKKAIELTYNGHPNKPGYLSNLCSSQEARFRHLGDLSDLENAISNVENAVELTDDDNTDKAMYLSNLSRCREARFRRLGELSDIENAISDVVKAVELTDDNHPIKTRFLSNLGMAQKARFEHLGMLADLIASISSFKAAAQLKVAYPSQALSAARQWAETSHLNGDLPSALDAYRTCLELVPKVAWLGLDTRSREDWLHREKSENIGCLAATCAIRLGCLEEAVELLDLSRSVFWQQASSLRSDLKTLREDEPELAEEFERIGRQIDAGNFSSSLIITGEHDVGDNYHSKEEIGKDRRRLVDVWERLLERIRKLSKFEHFLRPRPFEQLRQASTGGQVIIINASEYGVDALIFDTSSPIEHVSLPNIDLETLTRLSGDIMLQGPVNPSATQRRSYTTRILKPALRTVWNDIIVNIFDKMCIPLVDAVVVSQRRIWWYLTGSLTFIPIHAAGPGGGVVDVSRLVISSYVTTLQSLIQAQKKNGPVSREQPKLLSISQPTTPGQSFLPQTTEEVDHVVQVFRSSGWPDEHIICLQGAEATVDSVSCSLDSCSWVHFACHGSQDPVRGLKSAFSLHDGHLELGEIASKSLSIGQFAFLSACNAASGLKDLPGEAMHLAAGIQFSGFLSVIATMWSICDEDAPKVADHTYRYLFRNGLQGLNPSEAATALNRAILHLREDPNVTVDRWAPFIHFGI